MTRRLTERSGPIGRATEVILVVLPAGLLAAQITYLGLRQFGGFDCSALIELGWRLLCGQRPYGDFIMTMPVGFYLGAYYAFVLWGVRWVSFVYLAALFSAAAFVAHTFLLRRAGAKLGLSAAMAYMTQAATMVPAGFWWHNTATVVAGVLFVTAVVGYLRTAQSLTGALTVAASGALLLLLKPNTAIPLFAIGIATIALSSRRWGRSALVGGGALLIVYAVLVLHGLHVSDVFASYFGVGASRGMPSLGFLFGDAQASLWCFAVTFICIAACFLPMRMAGAQSAWRMVPRQVEAFLAGCGLIAAYGMVTNADLRLTDTPLLFAALNLPLLLPHSGQDDASAPCPQRRRWVRIALWTTILMVTVCGTVFGWTRYRVYSIGPGRFYERPATLVSSPAFFRGLHAGPRFHSVLQDVGAVLTAGAFRGQRDAPVFFGPRMEFCYATFQIESPKGCMPVWWHPGSSYPLARESEVVRAFLQSHFGLCIFLRNDFTYMPTALCDELARRYQRVEWGQLTLYADPSAARKLALAGSGSVK